MVMTAHILMLYLLFIGTIAKCTAQEVNNNKDIPMSKTLLVAWQNAASPDVHSAARQQVGHFITKKASYRTQVNLLKDWCINVSVTAFVSDQGGIWAGPEQEFYVETQSGIVGGTLRHGILLWCESLVSKRANERCDINSVVARFEKEVDGPSLATAYNGGENRTAETLLKRLTDLREFLTYKFFRDAVNAGGVFQSSLITGDDLQLNLKSNDGLSTASLWLNLKTRKVVKSVVDGKQVFPK
jgi:hypothetical protein